MEGIDYTSFVASSGNRITGVAILEEFASAAALTITWHHKASHRDCAEFEAWVARQIEGAVDITSNAGHSIWNKDPQMPRLQRERLEAWKWRNNL
jgi:hypothetical protein